MTQLSKPHVRTRQIREASRLAGAGRGLVAHRMIAETAVGLAEAIFEEYMSKNNELYRAFRQQLTAKQARTAFLARVAPLMLEEARLTLVDMLALPDAEVPERLKAEIMDALIKDNDLRANRSVAAQHAFLPGMTQH